MTAPVGNVPIGLGLTGASSGQEESFRGLVRNDEPGEYCAVYRHVIPLIVAAEEYCCRDPACTRCEHHVECSGLVGRMQASMLHHSNG